MVMSDDRPRETKLLDRGDYLTPKGETLTFAPPGVLPPLPEGAAANRLGLAQWLFRPDHPLTARVQVNRMWQHFFGLGLVKTAEDMGVQGEYPLHLPLLDWLALEFRDRGWSQKQIHRLIVTSATYRQSSRVRPDDLAKDPENRRFGRATRIRMPSAVLRDVALSSSGLLDRRLGGRPVYPYQPDEIWEALAITKERDFTYPQSQGSDLYRRSLYTFWRRTVSPANMFDAANRHQVAYGAHTPTLILLLVLVVGMLCGLLVGHDMGARGPVNWLHTLVFAAVVSLTIWVIYDLEMPRFGLIRVDDYDRLLRDLRDEFSRNVSEPGTAAGAPREPAEASPADDGRG